ncbi:MAG TPA: PKD domain-containing protein, partial [Planctomycetota bacterium]|nr:PKD domain-containing protein [Planctomycetota bacterium]
MRTAAIFLLLSSAAAAQVTVTGQFRYEDRTYDGTGFTGTAFRPVRQAEIELLSSGSTLVISTTDETGSFSFANIPSGLSLQVRVYARRVGGRINATVRNNAGANAIYAAISGTIDSSTTSSFGTLDLLRGGAGPAFNIFDCAVKSFQHLAALEPGLSLTPPPMNIFWELNSPNGTYFDGSVNGIFLLGLTSDPDQYDDDIILHEMGHWVAATFSKDDTLGGAHSVVDQLDPRTSWSEGWAHYWSATVRRFFSSEYSNPELQVDNFGSGRSVFDIELPSFPTLAIMATNELAVVAVLWDISDGGALEPFDTVSGFEAEIWRTLSVRIPARSNITLEDFHAGLSLEAPAIMPAVTGSETTAGIFKDRLIRYYVDGSEPNNTPGAPAPLPLGPVGLLQRTFYDSTDDDWFTLSATPGTLVVETLNLGDGADTGLQLYDATGTTLLASNDNRAAGDRTSRITLSLLVNTTFLVHVVRVGSVVEYGYYDLRAQILLNGPPAILSVSASALSGIAPLRVTFSASVSDPDGGSLEYLWDFDGDSLVDWSSLQGPDVTMTYDEAGTYAATLKVVDSGESTVGSAPLTITVWAADSPSIIPTVSVGSGAAPLTVTFDATLSGLVSTSYLWDFDGDGIADSASVTGPGATFTFRRPGTYSPRLIVRDRFGRAYRVPAPPVTVTATSPPSVSSFAVSGGYLPYAATFSMTHSSLGGSGSIAIDLDGDGRFDFVRAPTSTGSSSFLRELQRAGTFGARVRVIDSAGVAAETTATYTARSLGAAGWMVDPRDTD